MSTQTLNRVENISTLGRIVRVAIGAAMIAPIFFVSGPIGGFAILALLAILPVLCGIDGFCPLTAWYEHLLNDDIPAMGKLQRGSYAGVAIALIGAVFVIPTQALGSLVVLPLIGIYPAVVAIYGDDPLAAWIRSFKTVETKAVTLGFDNKQGPQRNNHHDHAIAA